MGQHSHVLNHVKFGRVHGLHVIFFYSQGLQKQRSTATLENTGISVALHTLQENISGFPPQKEVLQLKPSL